MVKPAPMPDQRTRFEFFQLQAVVVEQPLRFRIRRQQDLKSAIQAKALHLIGTHPPTWRIARLQ